MFCKNIACLAVAREHHTQQPLNHAPQQQLNQRYSYRTYYEKVVQNVISKNFPIVCSLSILLVQLLLWKLVILGFWPNKRYSYRTYCGKVIANLILNNVPSKIFKNIDISVEIHENVFPWQPTPIINRASFYQFIFQISISQIYLFF